MTERVLLTGMGGELGTRVANILEADEEVTHIAGFDFDPPRRRLSRAEFHRIDPRDRDRVATFVREFEPTTVVHVGVYEPNARSSPATAEMATAASATSTLEVAARLGSLRRIVVRSGIEVYGRGRGSAADPDEDAPARPTTRFGRMLADTEAVAIAAARSARVPLATLRMAPVVGPHLPSPLGRYLRLPAVPISAVRCPRFSLLHQDDAAAALVAAVGRDVDGVVNVVAPGRISAFDAVRMGGRLPVPTVGPGWRAAGITTGLWGAPLPDHVRELLTSGRTADGSRAAAALGVAPAVTTTDIIKELYDWAEVVYLDTTGRRAA